MLKRAATGFQIGDDNQHEHSFTLDVPWSLVDGAVVSAVCLVLDAVFVTSGG